MKGKSVVGTGPPVMVKLAVRDEPLCYRGCYEVSCGYYCIVLYCFVLYCIVLYCIVLHCIALHCIAFLCIAFLYNALWARRKRTVKTLTFYCHLVWFSAKTDLVAWLSINNLNRFADQLCLSFQTEESDPMELYDSNYSGNK